jgi:hypothetical protein
LDDVNETAAKRLSTGTKELHGNVLTRKGIATFLQIIEDFWVRNLTPIKPIEKIQIEDNRVINY